MVVHEPMTRQSLDSALFPRLPRSAVHERRFGREPPTAEEGFEDVGLNDEQRQHQQPKKRSFFSKFGSEHTEPAVPADSPVVSRFFMPGRKRAQSGQDAELGQMERPPTATVEPQEVQA